MRGRNVSKRWFCKIKDINFGLIIICIGVGIVITVIVPIWGWIAVVGLLLIYVGWRILEYYKH